MEDGFLCCLEASTVSNRPLDREPLPWQSPQHSREPPHHTESSRHPSHCVYSRKWGMGRDGHKWKWRKHSTEKKLLRVITLKCASRLRPRRLKACAEHCCRWPHFINKNVLTILFYFSLMNAPFNYFEQIITFYKGKIILGDPGADSGGEGKSKRVGKNGAKKSKERGGERVGTIFYQTSSKRSRPFWLLIGARNVCVFLPNQRAADLGILFVCSYMQSTWRSQPFAMFILAVRGGFTQGGEKIQCQNKIQGKAFGISTIISPVNALDLSQVSTLFENQSKLSKCLMNTSVRKHSKSRRFALYVVPWRRETYFKSSKCLACQNRFVTMHQ